MNKAIKGIAAWARSQGWTVEDTMDGYTQFFNPEGAYIGRYRATPSNPRRRMMDLTVALKRDGLQIPPPSKKELRSMRNKEGER